MCICLFNSTTMDTRTHAYMCVIGGLPPCISTFDSDSRPASSTEIHSAKCHVTRWNNSQSAQNVKFGEAAD